MPNPLSAPAHFCMPKMPAKVAALCAALAFLTGAGEKETGMLRGVLRSRDRLVLSTDLAAPVAELPFPDGAAFEKNDVLIRFDCSRLAAEAQAAEASHRAARIEFAQKAHLRKLGAAGQGEVDIASALSERAGAQSGLAASKMSGCAVRAPFAGKIAEMHVAPFEWPEPGKPLMVLVGSANLEIEMIAPSSWLAFARPGTAFAFAIEETGETITAKILRVGAEVDAVSQTVKLIGGFDALPVNALPGMSGTAKFAAGAF